MLDLLCAMLAVAKWDIGKTLPLVDALETEGLTALDTVRATAVEDIAERLARAGYRRGAFMCLLLAERWIATAATLAADGGTHLVGLDDPDRSGDLEAYLLALPGVGPSVVANYRSLRGHFEHGGKNRARGSGG